MTSSNGNIFRVTGHLCGEFPGEFPAQRPVTRRFDVFFDLRLNKRLNKQSWDWWLETLPRPLWRHSNGVLVPNFLTCFSGRNNFFKVEALPLPPRVTTLCDTSSFLISKVSTQCIYEIPQRHTNVSVINTGEKDAYLSHYLSLYDMYACIGSLVWFSSIDIVREFFSVKIKNG